MYNTPSIRSGGFGALQVEAVTNRALSVQRRHLAASQLRMRDIEPDELSQGEWVRFLVMEGRERERWISDFTRRRRESSASSSSDVSTDMDREVTHDKADEARADAEVARREENRTLTPPQMTSSSPPPVLTNSPVAGTTPFVSLWARHLDEVERNENGSFTSRRPMHTRREVDTVDAPPSYESIVPPNEAPPAYSPISDDEGSGRRRRSRLRRFSDQYLNRF
jgi:hypothetical protein